MRYPNLMVCASLILSMTVQLNAASASRKMKDNVDIVENAIIVDSLSLTTDSPPKDEISKQGEVMYDDSFDDGIIEAKAIKSGKQLSKQEIISELRNKDRRWHFSQYTVKKRDTLWGIAKSFNTSHRLIIRANSISGPDQIHEGRELSIPNRNGSYYTVKKGDTLEQISSHSKVALHVILDQNNKKGSIIKIGEKIFVPDSIPSVREDSSKTVSKEDRKDPGREDNHATSARVREIKLQRPSRISFIWPLKGKITSGFGSRSDPFSSSRQFHNGIDISAELGTPVKSIADGTVIFSGWRDGYGNLVVVKHDKGYISVYGHNSVLKFEDGDKVSKGQVIALSGMTGAVTGAHLHLEIQKYQTPLNPLRMLK